MSKFDKIDDERKCILLYKKAFSDGVEDMITKSFWGQAPSSQFFVIMPMARIAKLKVFSMLVNVEKYFFSQLNSYASYFAKFVLCLGQCMFYVATKDVWRTLPQYVLGKLPKIGPGMLALEIRNVISAFTSLLFLAALIYSNFYYNMHIVASNEANFTMVTKTVRTNKRNTEKEKLAMFRYGTYTQDNILRMTLRSTRFYKKLVYKKQILGQPNTSRKYLNKVAFPVTEQSKHRKDLKIDLKFE